MYNLKTVYAVISLDLNNVNFLISENANGSFNLIWSHSFKNDNFYNSEKILSSHNFKAKIKETLTMASEHLSIKIKKVLISFEGIVDYLNIKPILTKEFTYVNKTLTQKRLNEYVDEFCATNSHLKTTNFLSWKLVNFVDVNSKNINLNNLEAGKKYRASLVLYTSDSDLVAQINGLIYSLGYEIMSTSLCQVNFHSLLNSNSKNSLVIDIHKNKTHLLTFLNESLIKASTINFGESDIFDYITKYSQNLAVNKTKVIEMVSTNISNTEEQSINLVCQTGDEFLNMGFLSAKQISNLLEQSLSKLADFVNLECKKIKEEFDFKINQILIVSQIKNIRKKAFKLKKFLEETKEISVAKNNFSFLKDEFYLAAIAIVNQVKYNIQFKKNETCIETYYSENFDRRIDKKFASFSLSNDVNSLIQKLIK